MDHLHTCIGALHAIGTEPGCLPAVAPGFSLITQEDTTHHLRGMAFRRSSHTMPSRCEASHNIPREIPGRPTPEWWVSVNTWANLKQGDNTSLPVQGGTLGCSRFTHYFKVHRLAFSTLLLQHSRHAECEVYRPHGGYLLHDRKVHGHRGWPARHYTKGRHYRPTP